MELRADLENRIYKQKNKNNLPKWLFFCSLAMCFIAGLMYINKEKLAITFDGPEGKFVHFLKPYVKQETITPIIEKASLQKVMQHKAAAAKHEDVRSPTIEKWEREDREKELKKQTVFNDDNYQPRGSVNTIAPPPSKYYTTAEARSKAQVSEIFRKNTPPVEKRTIPWKWKSEKTYRSGVFTYIQRSGKIETHTVCKNYKYGSFEYRDCRKAAKKYFKNACSPEFRAACAAGDMIP